MGNCRNCNCNFESNKLESTAPTPVKNTLLWFVKKHIKTCFWGVNPPLSLTLTFSLSLQVKQFLNFWIQHFGRGTSARERLWQSSKFDPEPSMKQNSVLPSQWVSLELLKLEKSFFWETTKALFIFRWHSQQKVGLSSKYTHSVTGKTGWDTQTNQLIPLRVQDNLRSFVNCLFLPKRKTRF